MEPNRNTITKEIVLTRAHRIYFFRPLFSRAAAAFVVLGAALFIIGRKVWVARVFENMPSPVHVAAVARFFEAAFLNTNFVVQVMTIVSLGAGIWLARELAAAMVPSRNYA